MNTPVRRPEGLPRLAPRRRLVVLGLFAATVLAAACGPSRSRPEAALSIAGALSGSADGYARAEAPRSFSFPADHGPHPRYRTEWWYFTGNLEGANGERFGYQLTFFRNALAPPSDDAERQAAGPRSSRWATRQAWFAHFAVTDAAGRRFLAAERLARGGALGLAGASAAEGGLELRIDDWTARSSPPDRPGDPEPADLPGERRTEHRAGGLLPLRLRAAQAGAAIDLTLAPGKPIVLHGDGGLSIKGRDPASGAVDASYYYSLSRLPTAGTVKVGNRSVAVAGLSWMDREWSTSALADDQAGWDWFALQLDDGRDLMVYVLRRAEAAGGGIDPASSGTLVLADGSARHLRRGEVEIEVLDHWRSPATGARYPSAWRLAVPGDQIDLEIRPVLADQELDVGFRYWEGAVDFRGTSAGRPVTGRGYVELTGYAPEAAR